MGIKQSKTKERANQYLTITLRDGKEIKLAKKRAEFARLYALTGDATNSRLQAGYASHKANRQEAYKLLQEPNIQLAVEHYKAEAAKKLDISENRILAEMAAIGFSNIANLANMTCLSDIQNADVATQRAIKSMKTRRYLEGRGDDAVEVEIISIEMHPKLPALQKIAEIKGMAKPDDKNQHRPVNVNVNISGKSVKVDSDSGD